MFTSSLLTFSALLSFTMPALQAQDSPVGDFDAQGDVGAPKLSGSARYGAVKQEYTITGGGANIWTGNDQFHYVWKKLNGDFLLRTRVHFASLSTQPHRKVGWMIRPNLDADAPYIDIAAHGDGEISLQFRHDKGGPTRQFVLPITEADILQLERRGHTYIVSAAKYGDPFVSSDISDIDLGDSVYAGVFVCAHNANATETAVFRDVRLVKPVKQGFTPYHDYIGSVLEVLNVHTGDLKVLYKNSEPFEAPNWTRDGKALIYNVSGSGPHKGVLRRFDLATLQPTTINTGNAVHNNNDHVLSFDGTMLGVSNQGPETGNQSAVWVLPSTGGTPRLVTKFSPSYFHSWSPDAKWLVYTGGRREKPGAPQVFSIYKIPADGGDEIRLTHGSWLDDGPEYSPDGKYIYFNSTRSGLMQIWRMKPDGSDVEQVTGDGYNNWFPHISPDGKWIAFVSFLKEEVKPDDHPYYRHIYIRLMPTDGMGAAKIIAYVYGGQGTMNVPSWSPDSQRIAFVSNSDVK